ncbi:hypothetical protein [Streptomyces sp. P9-A4]|uniref:hypothetical protein n=1 Tax=Streptomyces sp. P9-A4 TaxID=3072285 RepID=UPI002FCB821D
MRKHRSAALAAATLLLLTGAGIVTAPAAWAGVPGSTRADDRNCDFDGDGFDDVLVGAPGAAVGGQRGAGLVTVQYGSPDGIDTRAATVISQNTPGVPGGAEAGDGYDDAVIGAPGEDIGTVADAGMVTLLRGTARGLTGTGSASWTQNSPSVPGVVEKGDKFGGQVRLVDPDADGRFGLLTAAPGEDTGDGCVWVFSAGRGGLTATGSWTVNAGTFGGPALDARYGAAIDE